MNRLALFPLLSLALLPLQAQSRFGLEIGNTLAQGDLRNGLKEGEKGKVGGTLGATFRLLEKKSGVSLFGGSSDSAIRLRVNASAYPKHSRPNTGLDVSGTSINLEGVQIFGTAFTGFQILGGFGLARWERSSSVGTQVTHRPVTSLGAGWQWSHVGVEARWSASSFAAKQQANAFETVFTVRF